MTAREYRGVRTRISRWVSCASRVSGDPFRTFVRECDEELSRLKGSAGLRASQVGTAP